MFHLFFDAFSIDLDQVCIVPVVRLVVQFVLVGHKLDDAWIR